MFVALFSAIFQFLLFVGACVAVYHVFVSDYVTGWKSAKKEKMLAKENASKVAMIKLVSGVALAP